MKYFVLVISLFLVLVSTAQTIVPGNPVILARFIRSSSYTLQWWMVRDTVQQELGEITVSVQTGKDLLTIVQDIRLKNRSITWIDSTLADIHTLSPVYHSSYNMQRDMQLKFGKGIVTGHYTDKMQHQTILINDTTTRLYFDSNIYPFLLAWLPLKEGYTANIPIYDYSGPARHGVLEAVITSVIKTVFTTPSGKQVPVYKVSVNDAISGQPAYYYIGIADRQVYQIEAIIPGAKMQMIRL